MKLCDRIPMNPREEDIVRNKLQNHNRGKHQPGPTDPKCYSYTSCVCSRVRSASLVLEKEGAQRTDTIRSEVAVLADNSSPKL